MSSLNVPCGAGSPISYIRLIAQSANTSRLAGLGSFVFSGPFNDAGTTAGFTGFTLLPGATLSSNLGSTAFNLYQPRGFSGFAGFTQGVAALQISGGPGISGSYATTIRVFDGSQTGSVRFTVRLF